MQKHDDGRVGKSTIAKWKNKYPWLVINDEVCDLYGIKITLKINQCVGIWRDTKYSNIVAPFDRLFSILFMYWPLITINRIYIVVGLSKSHLVLTVYKSLRGNWLSNYIKCEE
jgi:hypothetical protein